MEEDCHHDSPINGGGTGNGSNLGSHRHHGGDDDLDPNPNGLLASTSGGAGKPLLSPSQSNSNDTIQWCNWMDCALSFVSFGASVATFGQPPIDAIAFGVDGIATVWAYLRTEEDFAEGKISDTRHTFLNVTGWVGLVPWAIGTFSSGLNLFMTVTGIPN